MQSLYWTSIWSGELGHQSEENAEEDGDNEGALELELDKERCWIIES